MLNGTISTFFISVDYLLDFDASNRTVLNYMGQDLNTSLMAKNLLRTLLTQFYFLKEI